MNRAVIDEILALGAVRVQKIFGLFDHALVFELFSKVHRRLYLVFDPHEKTKSFHISAHCPQGQRTKSNPTALLTKYLGAHFIRFFKLDGDGTVVKAVDGKETALLFELDAVFKASLYHEQKLITWLPAQNPAPFREGYLTSDVANQGLAANFAEAQAYQKRLLTFHHEANTAAQRLALRKQLSKKQVLLKNVEDDRVRCEKSLSLINAANLLKSQLHTVSRGMKEVELTDFTVDPPAPITIALDPTLSPQEFLNRTFNKIKKAKRGLVIIDERLLLIRNEIAELQSQIDQDIDSSAISLVSTQTQYDREQQAGTKVAPRKPYRSFASRDGITIWVGKSAADSDAMRKLAKGNEWFFHARDVAGAHVIVKSSEPLPERTMLEAALLAHHFSKYREQSSSIVQYTQLKHVSKKKGLAPGKVLITQEKTIEITVDRPMLALLLAQA